MRYLDLSFDKTCLFNVKIYITKCILIVFVFIVFHYSFGCVFHNVLAWSFMKYMPKDGYVNFQLFELYLINLTVHF